MGAAHTDLYNVRYIDRGIHCIILHIFTFLQQMYN